jgi:hypothetical protein
VDDGQLDQYPAQCARFRAAEIGGKQFPGTVLVLGLLDAMLPSDNGEAILVQQGRLIIHLSTIEEVRKETGISRLKGEGTSGKRWQEVFDAVAYKTSKYSLENIWPKRRGDA